MRLSLAISPCPNDTYVLDALINGRIAGDGLAFDLHLADIQQLNTWAQEGAMDVCKVSLAAYPWFQGGYQLLTVGCALGRGVGPVAVSKLRVYPEEADHTTVAIPGTHTTANLLFSLAYPRVTSRRVYPFALIEEAVLSAQVDVGVLIHESRFTYQSKGLQLVKDLGAHWMGLTGLPTPLGGIAIRRSLPDAVKRGVHQLMCKSLAYAIARPSASYPFVRQHAGGLDDEAMRAHIELYVNELTQNLGDEGERAVRELFRQGALGGFCPGIAPDLPVFVG